jgi:hypothetical protein
VIISPPARKAFRKKLARPTPNRLHFSLATMFAAITLTAVLVAAANATGLSGIAGVLISLWGGAMMWRSGETERFSLFVVGALLQLIALIVASGELFATTVY